jgi:hypothetical protein
MRLDEVLRQHLTERHVQSIHIVYPDASDRSLASMLMANHGDMVSSSPALLESLQEIAEGVIVTLARSCDDE